MYHKQHTQDFATYACGTRRIDFVLCTANVLPAVKHCGYTAFADVLHSDHRGLFIDFCTPPLFDDKPILMARASSRRLASSKDTDVKQYLIKLDSLLKHRDLYLRSNHLLQESFADHQEAQQLDSDLTRFSLQAETSLPAAFDTDYSVDICHCRAIYKIRCLQLTQLSTHLSMQRKICQLQQLYQIDLSPPNSVDEAKQLLATARKHLYQAAKQHKELRIQHLSVLLQKLTSSTDAADKLRLHRIKQIQNTEATRSVFAKIRYQRTSQHLQPINQLQVPLDPSDIPRRHCLPRRQMDSP